MDMLVPPQTASRLMSKVILTHHAQHVFCFLQSLFLITLATFLSLWLHPFGRCTVIHWRQHLGRITFRIFLSTNLSGYELEGQPSCFHFPSLSLALSVYVDDLALSGPKKNNAQFWSTLRKHVRLEDPAELSKVLCRNHVLQHQGGLALHSADFARQ